MTTILEHILNGVREGAELSPRESQCIRYAALGLTDNEIAGMLDISPRTVQAFMTKVQIKFGAKNRTSSVAIFICNKVGVNIKDIFES